MKNTVKNNPAAHPHLQGFLDATGLKPITHLRATAAQISAALDQPALDDTFLRNRVADRVIPKPVRRQYDLIPTLCGLVRWFAAKATATGELPGSYDSMQAMENALGTKKGAIKWLLKKGAATAQLTGSRIAPLPVIRRAFEVIAQVAEGKVTGIDGGDQINTNLELGKKLREERFKAERENALAERRIHDLKEVESAVRAEILSPVFNDLTGLEKKAHRLKYAPAICVEIVQKDFPRVRQKIAAQPDVASNGKEKISA